MIRFTHKFVDDFNKIYLKGDPYALVRLGDGERAFAMRRPITSGAGEYVYDGSATPSSRKVCETITTNLPGFYLGISCPCCDPKAYIWYKSHRRCPDYQLTFANLFVNANYQRFLKLDLKNTVLVSCKNGDFTVPEHATNPEWDYTPLLHELYKVDKPILVAAGPIKCGLILDYWRTAPNRQIILDVGSSMDWRIHGKPTRAYHTPGTVYARRLCRWGN